MTIRTLCKSASAATLLIALSLLGAQPAWATPPTEMGWASHFNGNTYIENDNLPRVPSSGRYFFAAYSYTSNAVSPSSIIFTAGSSLTIWHSGSDINLTAITQCGPSCGVISTNSPFPYVNDGRPHTVAVSIDSVTGTGQWAFDGRISPASFFFKQTLGNINWSQVTYWSVGGGNASVLPGHTIGNAYVGDLSLVYVYIGDKIDINTVLDGFYDTERGYAIRGDGIGRIPEVVPQVYLDGPPNKFRENGGTWTWPGIRGNDGGDFTVFGTLQNATNDAFEPGSPL